MSRRKSRAAVVVTAVVAVVGVASAAWAYYALTSTTSNATPQARSLSGAGAPAATVVSSTSVTVSWTLPASQVPGALYSVTNTTDGHAVCAVSTNTCTDTAALPGVANAYSIKTTLTGSTWQTSATTFSSAATPDRFLVSPSTTTPTAGTAFTVALTAQKWGGSGIVTDTTYDTGTGKNASPKTVVWSGLAASPYGNQPTYPASTVAFAAGVSTTNLTATTYDAGAATLSAVEGSVSGTASLTVSAALPELRFNVTPSPCGSGTAVTSFTGKISRDLDIYGNTASFSGVATVSLGAGKGTFSPSSVTFANNGAKDTGTFTYTASGNGTTTLTATTTTTGYASGSCVIKL